jgi:hypothetical protein
MTFLGSGRCHSCDRIVRRKVIRADSQSVPQFAGRSNRYDDHLVELSAFRAGEHRGLLNKLRAHSACRLLKAKPDLRLARLSSRWIGLLLCHGAQLHMSTPWHVGVPLLVAKNH